jgi:hypothetical protein
MSIPLITINDNLYHIIRLIPEHTGIDTNLFKGYTNTTNVFRKEGMFWFVRLIEEAEVIEDEKPLIEESLES